MKSELVNKKLHRKKTIILSLNCNFCNKKFNRYDSEIKKSTKNNFCNKSCLGKFYIKEKSRNWKGKKINNYGTIHYRIRKYKKRKNRCETCNKIKKLDIAKTSKKYTLNVNDYEWLCRSCHCKSDNRYLNFKRFSNAI